MHTQGWQTKAVFFLNWRPITFLNGPYKLIYGCFSFQIKSTLDYIISDTQTGFIKGRNKGENSRFIFDLMAYNDKENILGLLVMIDYEWNLKGL